MTLLIVADHNNLQLKSETLNLVTAAQKIHPNIDIFVAGYNCLTVAQDAANLEGISQVLHCDHFSLQDQNAEEIASVLRKFGQNYTHIIAAHNTEGKNFMPRVAALFDVGQISDVIFIEDESTFVRPIYAGNALITIKSKDTLKIMTVRSSSFDRCGRTSSRCPVVPVYCDLSAPRVRLCERSDKKSTRPDLNTAKVVISGGRGLQSRENFALIEQLADLCQGAVGASRAAVDAGYISNEYQIGQTGKIVAPHLYIGIGISGAIQHLAGMKESKVIVAINKDPEAPLCKIADYSLIGDLFDIVPEMINLLNKSK